MTEVIACPAGKSGIAAVGYFRIFFYIFVGYSIFLLKSNQAFYEL
jgi:hypothetical protein